MKDADLEKLEHEMREYNEDDWVMVANVMREAGA